MAVLQAIAIIELAKKGWVESIPNQTRAWAVLVHQLLALTLQFGGISPERCWGQLSVVPDFSGITHSEFEILIKHMIQTEVQSSIQLETDRALWWTFAGGQVNHTLKYGLQFHHDWKIISDNFKLKIEGDSVGYATLSLAIAQMSTPTFWEAPATQRFILSQLPEYRLSKFQRALPEVYSLEMVSNYLLDIPGVIKFLKFK
jgi:hypothetical protein